MASIAEEKIDKDKSWMDDLQNSLMGHEFESPEQLILGSKVLSKVQQYKLRLKRRELDQMDN